MFDSDLKQLIYLIITTEGDKTNANTKPTVKIRKKIELINFINFSKII